MTSDSNLQTVNPQDLANKLHGLSSNQFEQHYTQSCTNNRQPVPNLHQSDYLHPHNEEHPIIHTEPPVPSALPQHDIALRQNTEQTSIKKHWDYSTSCTASRPLNNSPPEKLRTNVVPTADYRNVANYKEHLKKKKSKKPKNAGKPAENRGTEMTLIEEKKDDVCDTGGKSSRSDSNARQFREEDDVSAVDAYSNVFMESNPR